MRRSNGTSRCAQTGQTNRSPSSNNRSCLPAHAGFRVRICDVSDKKRGMPAAPGRARQVGGKRGQSSWPSWNLVGGDEWVSRPVPARGHTAQWDFRKTRSARNASTTHGWDGGGRDTDGAWGSSRPQCATKRRWGARHRCQQHTAFNGIIRSSNRTRSGAPAPTTRPTPAALFRFSRQLLLRRKAGEVFSRASWREQPIERRSCCPGVLVDRQ